MAEKWISLGNQTVSHDGMTPSQHPDAVQPLNWMSDQILLGFYAVYITPNESQDRSRHLNFASRRVDDVRMSHMSQDEVRTADHDNIDKRPCFDSAVHHFDFASRL